MVWVEVSLCLPCSSTSGPELKLFQWGVNLEVWIRDCINRLIDHDTPQKPYLTVFKFFQVFKGQMLPSGKSSWGYVLCELRRQTSDQLDH